CAERRKIRSWRVNFCCARRCSRACGKPMRSRDGIWRRAMRRTIVGLAAVVFTTVSATAQSGAANWPDRPIHLLVPFAAGGSSDIVARLVAQKLSARIGQPIVVDNRAGASGVIATGAVVHAAADGYTLGLATTSTYAISPSLMAVPSYDPVKDFAPISMIGASPFVLGS